MAGPEDDSGGGCRRQLESGIPEHLGVRKQDENQGHPQAVQRTRRPLQEHAHLGHGEHDDGPGHRRGAAGDGNVDGKEQDAHYPHNPVGESRRFQERHQEPRQQYHVKTANGQNVYQSRPLEIAPQGLGNAAPVSGQESHQKSRFCRVQKPRQLLADPVPEMVKTPFRIPAAPPAFPVQHFSVGSKILAVQPLSGIEGTRDGRRFYRVPGRLVTEGISGVRQKGEGALFGKAHAVGSGDFFDRTIRHCRDLLIDLCDPRVSCCDLCGANHHHKRHSVAPGQHRLYRAATLLRRHSYDLRISRCYDLRTWHCYDLICGRLPTRKYPCRNQNAPDSRE